MYELFELWSIEIEECENGWFPSDNDHSDEVEFGSPEAEAFEREFWGLD